MSDFSLLFGDPEKVPEEELEEFFVDRIEPILDLLHGESFSSSKPGEKVIFYLGKGAIKLYIEAICFPGDELGDAEEPTGRQVEVREVTIVASLEKTDEERDALREVYLAKHRELKDFDEAEFKKETSLDSSRLWESVKLVYDYDENELISVERFTLLEDDDDKLIIAGEDARSERSDLVVFSDEMPAVEGTIVRLAGHLIRAGNKE